MNPQSIVVAVIVVAAAAYLGAKAWRKITGRGACGCEHCPVHERQGSKPGGTG